MNFFRIFRRKKQKLKPKQLRIDGVETVSTPTPDDSELAAQALLESLATSSLPLAPSYRRGRKSAGKPPRTKGAKQNTAEHNGAKQSSSTRGGRKGVEAYYRDMAEKIKEARAIEARMAMRYIAYCEEKLEAPSQPPPSPLPSEGEHGGAPQSSSPAGGGWEEASIEQLEQGLYKWQNAVEREGGELLSRWQHCVAMCIVKGSLPQLASPASP